MNFFKKIIYGLIKKNRHLPQEYYAKIFYEYYHGKKLNLHNPKDFNEKIQWLKVYYHPPILNQLVDKYAVREYVKEKIGEAYLNEVYFVYNNAQELDLELLPHQFVLKATHGSNMHLLVKNKNEVNKRRMKFLMNKWMRRNLYYTSGQEWVYKDVKPRIIAENYMDAEGGRLIDYKIFCFSGHPKFIQESKYVENTHCVTHYDLDWNRLDFKLELRPTFEGAIEKPSKLKEMIEIAKCLSGNFPFIRVDLYSIKKKIVFGELTCYPGDGRYNFMPKSFNRQLGDYIILPDIPKGKQEIVTH